MDIIPNDIQLYLDAHSSVFDNSILKDIDRFTNLNIMMPQMLSGYYQGQILAMLSKTIAPKNILEIGTFTGYSAICLAQGLQKDGVLHTIEINEELEKPVKAFFEKTSLKEKIFMHIGHATEIIPQIPLSFDLVFIDADKVNYPLYYDLVFERVNLGGSILIDNVLWDGKVTKKPIKDKKTEAIHHLNEKIQEDPRVENVLLPIRDGIMWARKIKD
jgi:caffeoyl-CoA O-methyltransferase